MYISTGFNTASGRHCCNSGAMTMFTAGTKAVVSIPQAVGTVATVQSLSEVDKEYDGPFQYRKR